MRTLIVGLGTVGMLTAATLALAGTAAAAPLGGGSAADAVNHLRAQGYDVQINGDQNAPLSECTVTGVSGLSGSKPNGQPGVSKGSTVYVGVDCNDDHDA
jgi:ketopantoate reductase